MIVWFFILIAFLGLYGWFLICCEVVGMITKRFRK